jgi:anaerobic ribonucleoside-triphosphate reductase activating protein
VTGLQPIPVRDPGKSRTIRVGRIADRCRVLGPGVRAVVWVAGCPLRCKECVTPELLSPLAGSTIAVEHVADRLLALPDLDGVTFSGGEPFAQAPALLALCDLLHGERPELSLMSYTGFTLGWLRARGTREQRELLDRLDILVDGPYLPHRHVAARWRGSSNQRVIFLTDRHRGEEHAPDEPAGMTFEVTADDGFQWMGVPPVRGFRPALEAALAGDGIGFGEVAE